MKTSITQKLFFEKYDHKLTLSVSHLHLKSEKYPHPLLVECLIEELDPKHGIRTRHTSHYGYGQPCELTIYFADKRVLELVQKRFGEHVTSLMEPLNESQTNAMNEDKVLVRKNLFHGKYRYCIRTSRKHIPGTHRSTSKHMDEMVKWCRETFKHREERQDFYIYEGFCKNFFFANASDVLMMKMVWSDDIDRTERILLHSEVPQNDE